MSEITLGKAGRVVIPKSVRDKHHLAAGDRLELESEGEKIVLRPVHEAGTMRKEKGMWVIKTGKPLTAEDANAMIDSMREERHRHILGPWPT